MAETTAVRQSITFSGPEIYYLSASLDAQMVFGVEDPFPGWLTEEIREAMDAARESLAVKGALTVDLAGEVVLDPDLAALVGVLADPDATLLLSEAGPNGDEDDAERTWFLGAGRAVELLPDGAGSYGLATLPEEADFAARILARWGVAAQPAPAGVPGSVPDDVLNAAREQVADGTVAQARTALEDGGLTAESAASLVQSFQVPLRSASVTALRRGQMEWEAGGIAMLEAGNGLWGLRSFEREGRGWVEITPCNAAALGAKVVDVIARFAATPTMTGSR